MPRPCRTSFRNANLRVPHKACGRSSLLIVRTFALRERRSRRRSRHRTARYRPKSRCPEIARGVRRHGRCAGQPLQSPAHTRRGRHCRPTAPGNRRRNIHWQSRVGRGLLRGRTECFRNGVGWSGLQTLQFPSNGEAIAEGALLFGPTAARRVGRTRFALLSSCRDGQLPSCCSNSL